MARLAFAFYTSKAYAHNGVRTTTLSSASFCFDFFSLLTRLLRDRDCSCNGAKFHNFCIGLSLEWWWSSSRSLPHRHLSNLSPNGIKEISTRYVHFQSESRARVTQPRDNRCSVHCIFSRLEMYRASSPLTALWKYSASPDECRAQCEAHKSKRVISQKGFVREKMALDPPSGYTTITRLVWERKRERREKERKIKREQEREDNISIVSRGERRERKFIPTPAFSKLVRRRGDRSISRKLAPLFSCLSSPLSSLSLVSRSPIPTREESKPDRFASTYSTMACLHGEHWPPRSLLRGCTCCRELTLPPSLPPFSPLPVPPSNAVDSIRAAYIPRRHFSPTPRFRKVTASNFLLPLGRARLGIPSVGPPTSSAASARALSFTDGQCHMRIVRALRM